MLLADFTGQLQDRPFKFLNGGSFPTFHKACPRMNFLIATDAFDPDEGGVATSVKRISTALARENCKVLLVTLDRVGRTSVERPIALKEDGMITVARIGLLLLGQAQRSSFQTAPKHLAIFRRRFVDNVVGLITELGFDVDVTLSFCLATGGFLGSHLSAQLGVPHLACVRGSDIGRNIFDSQCLSAIEFVLERANGIVRVNWQLQERMISVLPEVENKSRVIANSISATAEICSIEERSSLLDEARWPDDTFVLCFNGVIREKKGAFEIVEAMRMLDEEDHCARLCLVGPDLPAFERACIGPEFDRLVARNRILRLGNRLRGEVGRWLARGDVLLLPSLDDGHANALLEGMLAGLCRLVNAIFAKHVEDLQSGYVLSQVGGSAIADALRAPAQDRKATAATGSAAGQRVLLRTPSDEARDYLAMATGLVR